MYREQYEEYVQLMLMCKSLERSEFDRKESQVLLSSLITGGSVCTTQAANHC